MKRRALAAALLALVAAPAPQAQPEPAAAPESLLPSAAPAFVLLGAAPETVARPATPADFAATLAGAGASLSALPQDFAVEVAPFWLVADPEISWRDDVERDLRASLLRTFALSAATAEVGTEEDPATALAFGAAVALRSGRTPPGVVDTLRLIEQEEAAAGALLLRFRAERVQALEAERTRQLQEAQARLTGDSLRAEQLLIVQEFGRRLEQLDREIEEDPDYVRAQQAADAELTALLARFDSGAVLRREGWHVGLAGAAAWRFPEAAWEAGALWRWGAWGTVSYEGLLPVGRASTLTPMGVVRLLGDDDEGDVLDAGGRCALTGRRYSLSAEAVVRTELGGGEADYRVAGLVEVEVRPDVWVRASFGRDFEGAGDRTLLARLGLTLALSPDRYSPSERQASVEAP